MRAIPTTHIKAKQIMNNRFPIEQFIDLGNLNLEKFSTLSNNQNNQDKLKEEVTSNYIHVDNDDSDVILSEILNVIKRYVPEQKYTAYFENSFFLKNMTQSLICFAVPTAFIKRMIETHYMDLLNRAIYDILGQKYTVQINLLGTIETINNKPDSLEPKKSKPTTFLLEELTKTDEDKTNEINGTTYKLASDRYSKIKTDTSKTFETFIVGPSNSMANAFAMAVAKNPGKTYPAIYFHGNSGLGKTHLLHAISNYITLHSPHLKICFTSASAFCNEMVEAIGNKNMSQFQKKYTEIIDVLIIDDIHELKNKNTTQNEFFHVFNELHSKGKQLIFTSDTLPKDINGIEERIKTRLSSALVVEIQQPDFETRTAILKQKAQEKDIYLNEEVINLIASCVKNNIRELEGSLIKLGAYSDLLNVDIDIEIAKEQLKLNEINTTKEMTFDTITKAVTSYYKVQLGDLKGKSRVKEITLPRHVAMFMCFKLLKVTLMNVGEFFGNRDHTSVLHAIHKIENSIKLDKNLERQIYEIENLI
jgi:chromosomal replication initiator protein